MDFIAIDVETANADQSSICQVGLAEVRGGAIAERSSFLVDPGMKFDPFNVSIHGITSDMVRGQRSLRDALDHLAPIMAGRLIVSHGAFDRIAIQRACARHSMTVPECLWLDSVRVSRRAWPDDFAKTGFGLKSVTKHLGITLDHHDAGSDANAAAEIILRAVAHTGIALTDWPARVNRPILEHPDITTLEPNPDGPYFGEGIVFTGALEIPRREAAQAAANLGFSVLNGVSRKASILVVGDRDATLYAGIEKSGKHRKAEELIATGVNIDILSESDFAEMIRLN